MQKKHIAIFGAAFNPPTLGHLSIIQCLEHFDKVLLVPSFQHAWGKEMASFSRRCQWLSAFIQDVGLSHIELCQEEQHLSQGSTVTTWALLNHLAQKYPDAELTFVIGPDNLLNFKNFYLAEQILSKWTVLCCPEKLNIRSTMIRTALLAGENINNLTTPAVAAMLSDKDFIYEKKTTNTCSFVNKNVE